MVDTIKFSEFLDGGDLEPNQVTVGLESGENVQFTNPFPLLPPGSTGDRPAIAASMYYRLRFNTTLESYEYYSPVETDWVQLEDSTDIAVLLALLASHAPGEGASLIGLENQGTIVDKTVQDLANATVITNQNDGVFVNGDNLASKPTGFLASTTTTGALTTREIEGTTNQIDIANGDGSANPVASLSSTLDLPGTFTVQSSTVIDEIIDDDTMATATDTNLSTSEAIKAYVDGLDSGSVKSVTGTVNEIDVDNSDPQNPLLSLSATIDTPGTFTIQGTVALDAIIDDDTFATATDSNIPTSESVKAYVDGLDSGSVKSVTGTSNQVNVNNTDPQNPVLSLPDTLVIPATNGASAQLRLREDTAKGTAYVGFNIPSLTAATSYSFGLPPALPTANPSIMTINTAGTCAFINWTSGVSWTPVLVGSVVAGSPTGTFDGRVMRRGSQVFVTGRFVLTSKGGISGNISIQGIPFAVQSGAQNRAPIEIGFRSDWTNDFVIGGYAQEATTNILLYNMETDSTRVTDADLSDTSSLYFSVVYATATA
jgi:hypothetical protein